MVDRRDRRPSRTTRRPSRATTASRASTGRTAKPKGRTKTTRRAKPASRKAASKPSARRRDIASQRRVQHARAPKRRPPADAPASAASPLPDHTGAATLVQAAMSTAVVPPAAADPAAVVVRRRRRGPRVKFTRWLYSEDLYRQLGVSPRGQALVCRELRAERDGTWSACVAAVPAGFFEPTWVTVPPEVVVPVARPRSANGVR